MVINKPDATLSSCRYKVDSHYNDCHNVLIRDIKLENFMTANVLWVAKQL